MGSFALDDVQSFGGWIQMRRRAMNLTRDELAGRIGCAAVTIKKIERDERKPSRQMRASWPADGRGRPDRFMRCSRNHEVSDEFAENRCASLVLAAEH
jgi:transcriptional regulator with XRE-family HTH domain